VTDSALHFFASAAAQEWFVMKYHKGCGMYD
jgi:hypothetical protein